MFTFVVKWQERLFSGMSSKYFFGMEVTSNGTFGDFYFPLQFSNSDPFFASLIILLTVQMGGKNMGPLPGKFASE